MHAFAQGGGQALDQVRKYVDRHQVVADVTLLDLDRPEKHRLVSGTGLLAVEIVFPPSVPDNLKNWLARPHDLAQREIELVEAAHGGIVLD